MIANEQMKTDMGKHDIPPDLADALARAGLGDFFAGGTPAHRNEYLKWIGEARKPATRQARIAQTVQMLAKKCAESEG